MTGLFRTVTLRGEAAARLSWGYQTAAVLRTLGAVEKRQERVDADGRD